MRHFQCCDLGIGKDPQVPGSSGARLTGMGVGLQSQVTQLEPTRGICSGQESTNKSVAFCSHLPAKSAAAQLRISSGEQQRAQCCTAAALVYTCF